MFLSIVVPCYNEEQNIDFVYCNIKDNLPKYLSGHEIIFVDDGSFDNTAETVKILEDKDPNVRLVKLPGNMGYGAALKKGFSVSAGEYITYLDGDGQYDFKDFALLFDSLQETAASLVGGIRHKRADLFYRKMLAGTGRFLVFVFFGLKLSDIDCGFKLFKKSVLDTIELRADSGLIFSLELYLKTKRSSKGFTQVNISHHKRQKGKSKGINLKQYYLAVLDICLGKLF